MEIEMTLEPWSTEGNIDLRSTPNQVDCLLKEASKN